MPSHSNEPVAPLAGHAARSAVPGGVIADATIVEAPRKAVIVLNGKGGTVARLGQSVARDQIASAFAALGFEAEVILLKGRHTARSIRARVTGDDAPFAIVAAGGDGTVNTVAQELVDSGVRFGILPLGTLNHFARDLGLPLDIPGAVAVIAAGVTADVDAAEVNGRIFVNNSSIGLYPNMVRDRERQRQQSRRSKWLAMALAFIKVLRHPPVRHLTIVADDRVQPHRTPFAFVGNGVYGTKGPMLGRRATLTGGVLCLFVAKAHSSLAIAVLVLRAIFGRLDDAEDFAQSVAKTVTIRSRRRRLSVAFDGEVGRLATPLHYRIRPGALRVLVPERK